MSGERGNSVNQEFMNHWTDDTLPAALQGGGARNIFIAVGTASFYSLLPIMRCNIERKYCKVM